VLDKHAGHEEIRLDAGGPDTVSRLKINCGYILSKFRKYQASFSFVWLFIDFSKGKT